MTRANVNPKLLTWARERAGIGQSDLLRKFPKLVEWERGELRPTFKQLENFAKAVFVPFGYLFLADPPEEKIPIPHYRSERDAPPRNPSPDLLDTIYTLERRQVWMRRHLIEQGCARLPYVGSATVHDSVEAVVDNMRDILGLDPNWAEGQHTWQEALACLRDRMERAGVFVVSNGVVGNNTHRRLDVSEFRGFVLADEYAPFVFVNGADAQAAQMFTLAHELAHVFFGSSAAFDLRQLQPAADATEKACNRVAAEFLVPSHALRQHWERAKRTDDPFKFLGRRFKVSVVVAARRALDADLIDGPTFRAFYADWQSREHKTTSAGGGNFYNTQNMRVGVTFASAVIAAAKSGKLPYLEAYELTGLHGRTFEKFARRLGIDEVGWAPLAAT